MNRPGPRPETLAKIEQVRGLLREGNKLVWSLAEVGLAYYQWYRWSGAAARRDALSRPRRPRACVSEKVAEVDALISQQGLRRGEACRMVGLSYFTYYFRKAKEARGS